MCFAWGYSLRGGLQLCEAYVIRYRQVAVIMLVLTVYLYSTSRFMLAAVGVSVQCLRSEVNGESDWHLHTSSEIQRLTPGLVVSLADGARLSIGVFSTAMICPGDVGRPGSHD